MLISYGLYCQYIRTGIWEVYYKYLRVKHEYTSVKATNVQ
jgi:hypothetical protein